MYRIQHSLTGERLPSQGLDQSIDLVSWVYEGSAHIYGGASLVFSSSPPGFSYSLMVEIGIARKIALA